VRPPGRTPWRGSGPLEESLTYRLLLWCLRTAWVSCAVGTGAMLPALVLGWPALVRVFELGLLTTCAASAAAVLLFGPLLTRVGGYGLPEPRSLGSRVDTLVAVVLADLLDPD
jgi:hypothetical protein